MSVLRFLKLGFLGARAIVQSLADKFDDLLSSEETAGNDNVFYNPQDLTSLRVGTDGSGGNPTVGDPVGMMLDTSGLAGSMDEFLGGQTELSPALSSWTLDTTVSESGGRITFTAIADFAEYQLTGLTNGGWYEVTLTHNDFIPNNGGHVVGFHTSSGYAEVTTDNRARRVSGSGTTTVLIKAPATTAYIKVVVPGGGTVGGSCYFEDFSVKEIPGNHAIAPSDAARPVLMDDPDTTWASLTDDGTRGEAINSVTSYGSSGGTENGLPFEQGSDYEVTFTVESRTVGTMKPQFTGGVAQIGTPVSANGTYTETLTATNNANFQMVAGGGFDGTVSNISVRKVNTAFDARGPELVTNGTFDSDTTGWTPLNGATLSVVDGRLRVISDGSANYCSAAVGFPTEVGEVYEVTVSAFVGTAVRSWVIKSDHPSTYTVNRRDILTGIFSDSTTTQLFTATATTTYLHLLNDYNEPAGAYNEYDNISVKKFPSSNLLLNTTGGVAGTGDDDNSTFDTDTGNWTLGTNNTISGGLLNTASGSAGYNAITLSLTPNAWYKVQVYVTVTTGTAQVNLGGTTSGTTVSATGWFSDYIRAGSTHAELRLSPASGFTGSWDNVIVQELPTTTPTSYYLDVDGVDDWMEVTPTLNLGEQWWHTGAWQSESGALRFFGTSSIFQGAVRTDGSRYVWYNPSSGLEALSTSNPTTKNVLTIEQSDTNGLSARFNGVQEVDPITPYDDSGSTQGLALFSQQNISYGSGLDGRFYGGAWGQGQVDYDELTTLQDYLGTLVEPDIDPTDVTSYANVYEMLDAQTAAALFDIDDTTSLRVETDGSGGVPVDGDPVGMMMDVSGTSGSTMAAYLDGATELVTNGTFDTDTSGWSGVAAISAVSGRLRIENSGAGYQYAYQSFSTTSGQFYKIDVELFAGTAGNVAVSFINGIPSGPSGGAGSKSFIVQATSSSIQIRITCNVATTSGVYVEADNISVKPLPGYVATAPSDAARPTLASVLDETASELTDDGTRGPETITTSYPATFVSQACGLLDSAAMEVGELYEITWDVASTDGSITLFLVDSAFGGSFAYQVLTYSAGTGSVVARCNAKSINGVYVNGTATINSISVKKVQTVFDGRGDELVTNGGFDADLSDWNELGSSGLITWSDGAAVWASGGRFLTKYNPPLETGKFYEVTIDIEVTSGSLRVGTGALDAGTTLSSTGTHTFLKTPQGALSQYGIYMDGAPGNFVGQVNSISVKEVLTPNLLLTSAGDDDSTFDSDTGNWTKLNATISGGVANIGDGVAANAYLYQTGILTAGRWYYYAYYIGSYTSGSARMRIGNTGYTPDTPSTGWHTGYFKTTGTDLTWVQVEGFNTPQFTVDNVIVQEVPASVARAFYLDFDGVDDNLILDGTDFGSSTNATLYKTFRGDSTDTVQIMFGTNAGTGYALVALSGSVDTNVSNNIGAPVFREDGAIASYANRGAVFTALVDNTDHTIGVEEADLSASATWASSGFYIGGEYNATYDNTGRLYSWAAVDTRLDGRNRDLLENFMISKKTS